MFTKIAIAASLALVTSGAFAEEIGDKDAGKVVFRKCQACHMVGPGAQNRVGPQLNGIFSSKVGEVGGFKFSKPFHEWAEHQDVWTAALMDEWLTNPKAVVPSTRMVFAGLPKPQDRADLIAYLASFDADGNEQDPASVLGQ